LILYLKDINLNMINKYIQYIYIDCNNDYKLLVSNSYLYIIELNKLDDSISVRGKIILFFIM
jgi:hypothetical protein